MQDLEKLPQTPVRFLEIDATREGQRLDNFLIATLKGVPKSRIYRILRRGEVRINRGRTRPDYRLQAGDIVRIPPIRTAAAPAKIADNQDFSWLDQRIIHEDEHLIAIDKPAGLAVHGGSGLSFGLIEALRQWRPNAPMLELVHRLDRETSGCLLIAKSRPALLAMHGQLQEGDVDKRYLALIKGSWRSGVRRVQAGLEKNHPSSPTRMVRVAEEGKAATSEFTPQRKFEGMMLVEIKLLTGRTHQARVHAVHLGHPIAGDDKYGDREFNRHLRGLGLKRLFLHAASLNFKHPVLASKMRIQSPLAPDLAAVLEQLDES